ncbi:MAG: M28 family metallopeptidase [Gemmatimonadota bacterium]
MTEAPDGHGVERGRSGGAARSGRSPGARRPFVAAGHLVAIGLVSALAFAACGGGDRVDLDAARAGIAVESLAQGVRDLSADSMGGRAPASIGEERTVRYLRDRFEALGLEPGAGDGWFQEVALVAVDGEPSRIAEIRGHGTVNHLQPGTDYVAVSGSAVESVEVDDSELVFAGYGIIAPEHGWNDYADLDVRGKTVVVLVNDPGYATGDTMRFDGRAMTYYGRWTYKYEEAGRQGATGVLVVHSAGPAGYPWDVVRSGWTGEQFLLEGPAAPATEFQGWLAEGTARTVFAQARFDFDSLAEAAAEPGFRAVPLGLRISLGIRNGIHRSTSRNVIARLPGRSRPDEHVVYMGHWDHLGTDPSLEGDSIYNGALDNATGVSGILEIAGAFRAAGRAPERSVLFLAVTAEEQGLLGSKYYAEHPVWPLAGTVAAINLDALNIYGPTRDVTVVGFGMSALDSVLAEAAGPAGRVLAPEPEPEKGSFFRSDHFEFAKQGVPALYLGAGVQDLRYGEAWARARHDEYTAERYHKPGDEYGPAWNLEGAVEDLRLLFTVGWSLADSDAWPNWREGTEFRALRDAMRPSPE